MFNKDISIKINISEKILSLLILISCGWSYKKYTKNNIDLKINFDQNKYIVYSKLFPRFQQKKLIDIVSLLNEIFIFIAYRYTSYFKNFKLLHCCALNLNNKNIIIFGKHKSGKSSFCASKSTNFKNIIYGDDLLLFESQNITFKTLGFPIRLRRPLNKTIFEHIDKSKIIAGKKLAYIATKFFNNKCAGHIFEVDNFYEISNFNNLKKIKFTNISKILHKYVVDINKN